MREIINRFKCEEAYSDGYKKRVYNKKLNRNKIPFGNKELTLKSFWLAGWHDRDMETGNG